MKRNLIQDACMMLKSLLAAVAAIAVAPGAVAQEQAWLSLADVMSLSARSSPAVATSRATLREAKADITTASSLFQP
jgi:hypothetical protein